MVCGADFPNQSIMNSKSQAAYSKRLFADNLDRHSMNSRAMGEVETQFEEVLGSGKSSPSMTELFR